ncbi:MAG: hypothetical protein HY046_05120, partial [Acidobacteria bacterium]|nr:hypothetical protein [Acidobacteriota bacterium]
NSFQTVLFLSFGAIALIVIGRGMGGFSTAIQAMQDSPAFAPLLTRERFSPAFFLSYTFIPLSTIVFPHVTIFCLTARKMVQFRKTVILYPLCIMAIWLPSVFLGVVANRTAADIPAIQQKIEGRRTLATRGAQLTAEQREDLRRQTSADDVILLLLNRYAPVWLSGLLGAGIMAAVMASDSQILALSTMFTEDVFAYYGHKERFGEAAQVHTGRLFVILLTVAAYVIALRAPASIFELAVQYAFTGFSAMIPLLIGALFWKGSNKWGALASTVWVVIAVVGIAVLQAVVPAPPPGPGIAVWSIGETAVITRSFGGTAILGLMPVLPVTLISALLMIVVSAMTPKPSPTTVARYFEAK